MNTKQQQMKHYRVMGELHVRVCQHTHRHTHTQPHIYAYTHTPTVTQPRGSLSLSQSDTHFMLQPTRPYSLSLLLSCSLSFCLTQTSSLRPLIELLAAVCRNTFNKNEKIHKQKNKEKAS